MQYCFTADLWTDCFLECDAGHYGPDCALECLCQNGGRCDRMTGCCECTDGFYGQECEFGKCKTMEWYHNLAVVVKYTFGKIIILNKLNKETLVID